jgi:hypothetical protein
MSRHTHINVHLSHRELEILTSVLSEHVAFLESEGDDEGVPELAKQYDETKELLTYLEDSN